MTSSWGLPTSPDTQNPGHMWWKTRRTMGRWSPRIGENPSQCRPDVRYELERLPRQAQNYVLPRQPTTVEPMAEFIYQMIKTRKKVGDKVILDDVTMSFHAGAKIGMVGPNGAGKSTILKIMAGLDEPSNGDAWLAPGYSVGIDRKSTRLNSSHVASSY